MQTLEQFTIECKTNYRLLAESQLTATEWQALKDWVFHSCICDQKQLDNAITKWAFFNAFMTDRYNAIQAG